MRLPRRRAWLLVCVTLATVVPMDLATGPEVNLIVFYLTIACFGSWCLGEKVGLAVGAISVAMQFLVHLFGIHGPTHHIAAAALAWNMFGRSMSMVIIIALAGGLRHSLDHARWSATTDALTGVLNKAAFQRRLSVLVGDAQRRGDAVVLAYLDLDGFKGVNDAFGHAAGDRLLCTFATQASEAIRAHDMFARVGGDEFVALLSVPTCDQGDIAAERLHHRLSMILHETGYPVTCSIGAMIMESRAISAPDALVDAADALMYEVKHSGKNALRIARLDLQPGATEALRPMRERRANLIAMADAA